MNHFRLFVLERVRNPRAKIMGFETLFALHLNDLGMAKAEEMQ
jgi:hypothetical protein